ncbi:serine/threonine protein kinase [Stemphylium lycopersici]|uniref:Serine/threonine protein kinase n=1 Tax=Stemphylium lycopersici TaxID=183478 RepID=A0A364MUZ2_STELY|nr:serine/threonine protein kinase [Stemphylium lycopersici]
MVDVQSISSSDGSGPARQEPDDDPTGRAEPEQTSRSRSDPGFSSDSPPYISEYASRPRSSQSVNISGSSGVRPQSVRPSAIRSELENLFEELRPETLAGPVALIGRPKKLGEGGQFYVYRQEVGFMGPGFCDRSLVAVKRPKISATHENSDSPIDLADPKVQRSLGYIRNEIRALTHAGLQRHPNIVTLLSWAFGEEWDRPLVLVLELAHEDLATALKQNDAPPDHLKLRFCNDIANGLGAIHEAQLVHGDLKPENVLIFREETGFVAKLADFGYSADGSDMSTQAAGGTLGWQPPEIKPSFLGDCFSYGLLVWSVLFLRGKTPPLRARESRRELALADVRARTSLYDNQTTSKDDDPHATYNFVPNIYAWEIQPRSAVLLEGLYRNSKQSSVVLQSITSEEALSIGLHFTVKTSAANTESWQIARKFLEISADLGNFTARGIASRVCRTICDFTNNEQATKWLELAAETGSTHARADLRALDPRRLEQTLELFRSYGGYNMFYWRPAQLSVAFVPQNVAADESKSTLHGLAAFGSCKNLQRYLNQHRSAPIDEFSERKETALHVACACGSWGHTKLLIEQGADPSIKCTEFKTTSLHWAFAFDSKTCGIAVKAMIEAGANVNALTPPNVELPFPHYPFVLPAGTPLHWAVATSSHDAIRALIEEGANPLLRNGSDPYMYDDRIRHMYAVGGPDAEGCTSREPGCLGLSAVDLAAVHRDPFLLQLVAERKQIVDINAADEEGFTVLHRLATSQIFRTSQSVRYSAQMFRELDETALLRALIVAIQKLGGDIERLTSDADTAIQKKQRDTDLPKSSYTPLMLAMLEADHSLVRALLDCGASANKANASQATALFHISHRANAEQPQLLQCFQTLFNHGASLNHHSSNENTALLTAAQGKVRNVFELFLSLGAHIDERDKSGRTVFPGKSVFAFFASFDDSSDEFLLKVLDRYVFHSSEHERKRRVIQGGSHSGSTLLHECAGFAMPNCVRALLYYGARVNALERRTSTRTQGAGSTTKAVLYETPLDRLKSARSFNEGMFKNRNKLSQNQWNIRKARWETVVRERKLFGPTRDVHGVHQIIAPLIASEETRDEQIITLSELPSQTRVMNSPDVENSMDSGTQLGTGTTQTAGASLSVKYTVSHPKNMMERIEELEHRIFGTHVYGRFHDTFIAGWRAGLLRAFLLCFFALITNIAIYASLGSTFDTVKGTAIIIGESCSSVQSANIGIHAALNILSTLVLGASTYAMQGLTSPSRKEVDATHAKGKWLEIGTSSVRNLLHPTVSSLVSNQICRMKIANRLNFNAVFFITTQANQYAIALVAENYLDDTSFQPTEQNVSPTLFSPAVSANADCHGHSCSFDVRSASRIIELLQDARDKTMDINFIRMESRQCMQNYSTGCQREYSDILVVSTSVISQPPLLWARYPQRLVSVETGETNQDPFNWICSDLMDPNDAEPDRCSLEIAMDRFDSGGNWTIQCYPVSHCLARTIDSTCQLQFYGYLMIAVVVFGVIKVLTICYLVFERPAGQYLRAIGDAIASFLEREDSTTKDMCLITSQQVRKHGHQTRYEPQVYTDTRPRWFTAANTTEFFASIGVSALYIVVLSLSLCSSQSMAPKALLSPMGWVSPTSSPSRPSNAMTSALRA